MRLALVLAFALPALAFAEDKIDTSGAGAKLEAFRKDMKKGADATTADVNKNVGKQKKPDPKAKPKK